MVVGLGMVTALMAVMATKHLVADFLLQTDAIARGKAAAQGWLAPLLLHAGGHAAITLLVALLLCPAAWWLAPAEWVLHAAIDRAKVIVGRRAHLDMTTGGYWWLFGLDQYLHQLTNIAIVFVLLATEPA